MASLYRHPESKFWWIRFRDPATGKMRRTSTKFRIGVGADTRRAESLRAEFTVRETQICPAQSRELWDRWVPDYVALRYSAVTKERVDTAWRSLKLFFKERQITTPRQLTRDHCFDYMAWRQKPNKSIGKYRAGHNTALLELKFLGVIMFEAVQRKFAPFNPVRDLHIKRQPGKVKPELTAEVVAKIRAAIVTEPEPLRTMLANSFEIAYHHGVRLSGTHLNPMTDVYVQDGSWRITFKQKGGRISTKILHPNLIPLFRKLRADGQTETYHREPYRQWMSANWFRFLERHGLKAGLPGLSFHSTRVTVASTLARNGISEKKAMEFVDHASTTIHRSYVRLRPEDLQDCLDAIT